MPRCLLILVLALFQSTSEAIQACGLDWKSPESHFEKSDHQGNVMFVEPLASIKLASGFRIPLIAVFSSANNSPSFLAGSGWQVPLLESTFVRTSEDRFRMLLPHGWDLLFWPIDGRSDILAGQGGWKAAVNGDTITAWAPCGSKLVFKRGRLLRLEDKIGSLDFIQGQKGCVEIREGEKTLLKVANESSNRVTETTINLQDEHLSLEMTQRPLVTEINQQRLVSSLIPTLGRIRKNSGDTLFEYEPTQSMSLSIRREGNLVTWNPLNGAIETHNGWQYSVSRGKGPGDNAAISRWNANGDYEYWYRNDEKGTEHTIDKTGVSCIRERFVGGKLAGALRSIRTTVNSKETKTYQASYDASGHLTREKLENGETLYHQRGTGGAIEKTSCYSESGELLNVIDFNDGLQTRTWNKSGTICTFTYDGFRRQVEMHIDGKIHSRKDYATDGTWELTTIFDGERAPERKFFKEFDAWGNLTKELTEELVISLVH